MVITGKNLSRVLAALEDRVLYLNNMIVTCPEPQAYAEDLAAYEQEKAETLKLRERVKQAMKKEQSKCS